MRNEDLYSPNCKDECAKALVTGYVMRDLLDGRGAYRLDGLLARQYAVYEEWLDAMRESGTNFDCGFYEWLRRDCDSAFVFRPGDLVKSGGRYCVVVRRCTRDAGWTTAWRLRHGRPAELAWPKPSREVELKYPDGRTCVVDALSCVEPADIPPEVFALACGRAKDCPMMKGE